MSYSSPEHRPPEPTTNQEWLVHTYTARDWAYGIFHDKTQHVVDYSTDGRVVRGVNWTGDDGLTRYELECIDDYHTDTGFDIASRYCLMVCHNDRPWEHYQIVAGEADAYQSDENWEIIQGQDLKASTKQAIRFLRTNPIDATTMETYSDMDDAYWKLLEANGMHTYRYRFARWCGRLLSGS